jgi:hypothetical protein
MSNAKRVGIPYEVFVREHEKAETEEQLFERVTSLGYTTTIESLRSRASQVRHAKNESQFPLKFFKSGTRGGRKTDYAAAKARVLAELNKPEGEAEVQSEEGQGNTQE